MTSTQKGDGVGVALKFPSCLRILLFKKKDVLFILTVRVRKMCHFLLTSENVWLIILRLVSTTSFCYKRRYTYDIHKNCLISKTPTPSVHLRPNFFHNLDLGRPVLNEPSPPLQQKVEVQNVEVKILFHVTQKWVFTWYIQYFKTRFWSRSGMI